MDIATVAIETAVKHVIEKIKQGKKLTTEDILILYLGSISEDVRAMRAEAAKRERALREEIAQLRGEVSQLRGDVYTKIDEFRKEVNIKFDEVNKRLDTIVTEFGKRFDELYKLLITALTQKRES